LANTAWAFAALGFSDQPFFRALFNEALFQLPGFGAQALANTAWAVAVIAYLDDRLLSGIAHCAQTRGIAEFGQQQLANTAWAFAAMAVLDHPLMSAISAAVLCASEWRPQALANTAWAYAKLGLRNKPVMEALAAAASQTIDHFDPQNLSNMAWALAKLSMMHEPLLNALAATAVRRASALGPRELAGLAWAFASLKVRHTPFLEAISDRAMPQMLQFEPLDIANMAWAFSSLLFWNTPVVAAISSAACSKLAAFDSQPLSSLVDLELPGCEVLEKLLAEKVDAFAQAWIREDAFSGTNALLRTWQVDNFGIIGTKWLLGKLGVHRPGENAEFVRRAREAVSAIAKSRTDDWRRERFFVKERVFCFLEFNLHHPRLGKPAAALLSGSLTKENSFLGAGTRAGRSGLLRPWALPISELVDRSLCAEFQALSHICDLLDDAGVKQAEFESVSGDVLLWTSGSSCLSCVRTMRQLLQLLPQLRLQVFCDYRAGGAESVYIE